MCKILLECVAHSNNWFLFTCFWSLAAAAIVAVDYKQKRYWGLAIALIIFGFFEDLVIDFQAYGLVFANETANNILGLVYLIGPGSMCFFLSRNKSIGNSARVVSLSIFLPIFSIGICDQRQ